MNYMNSMKLIMLFMFIVNAQWVMASEVFSVTGCGISKKAYMEEAMDVFTKKKGIISRLSGGGATKGLQLTSNGTVSVGASCRQRLADIGGNIFEKEKDIKMIHVAWDAIVVIANPNLKVDNISIDQLRDIYEGKITTWDTLGGANIPIKLLTRKGKHSGVGYMARLLIFNDPNYEYKVMGNRYRSTGPIEKAAMQFEGALALDGMSSAKKVGVKIMDVNGFKANKDNISSGSYPFFRPLYIAVNTSNKDPLVQEFVSFLLGPEGQSIISKQGTVNLKEGHRLNALWKVKTDAMGKLWQENI